MAFPPAFEWARTAGELKTAHKNMDDEEKQGDDEDEGHGVTGSGAKDQAYMGLPDVFKPQVHIFYERRVVDIIDGLPKWRKHKDSELMGEDERP